MRLDETVRDLESAEISGDPATEVLGLAYDSRQVRPGSLFFCVPGERFDGHDHAPDAVSSGAVALVCERPIGLGVPEVVVPDARAAMSPVAVAFNGHPTGEISVAGITGTNGKTTTSILLRDILEAAGRRSGLIGTVMQVVGGVESEAGRTTPEAIDLQATFRRMADAGDIACVMEVSSHALALGRCEGISFDVAVFTNLSQDHLDFHADMEDYFGAKRLLFESDPGASVVNIDDEYGRRLAAEFDAITFSTEARDADYMASEIEFDPAGSRFVLDTPDGSFRANTRMPGRFNVSNSVAAVAAAVTLGLDPDVAIGGLASAGPVAGRLEPIDAGQDFSVLVDYAHTPDSLENALEAVRELCSGRVITVVGAGGDRDRSKRPLMGAAAAAGSDLVVVTSDNPRSEEPGTIIDEVVAGIPGDAERIVEVDRFEAIATAISAARIGDAVLIAGKGHEQGQEFEDGRKIPFDDRDVARRHLAERGGADR
jgi:UDP-N-acetylmuramoyl-L-alanyl-D-glutamate--2,6-diaminopimelate ligase